MSALADQHLASKQRKARIQAAAIVDPSVRHASQNTIIGLRGEVANLKLENGRLKTEIERLRREVREAKDTAAVLRGWGDIPPHVTLRSIIDAVAEISGVTKLELIGVRRETRILRARQLCYFIMAKYSPRSFSQIGVALQKDHSTVMHGAALVQENMPRYRDDIAKVMKKLGLA
jgi:hypothetical protein